MTTDDDFTSVADDLESEAENVGPDDARHFARRIRALIAESGKREVSPNSTPNEREQ